MTRALLVKALDKLLTCWPKSDPLVNEIQAELAKPEQQAEIERLRVDAERYRWIAGHCESSSIFGGSRWSIQIVGPLPTSHNSEDDFDTAIDSAMKDQP